jgi:two-component system phosphate regulon sensor histidine kinase PhoR
MNKRIIIGLVILMGISLFGIIVVQIYWFNNSVKVRNELFDRSVNEAMTMAVRRLETRHDLKIIKNFASVDSVKWDEKIPPPPPPPIEEFENIDVVVKKDSIKGVITVITSKSDRVHSGSRSFKIQAITQNLRHPVIL